MRDTRADLLRWCGWFLVCAAALFELLALRYLTVVTLPEGAAARAFSLLMFVSHGVILASLVFVLLLPVVLLLPRRRWVVPAGLLLALAWLTLTVVDGFVWQQYRLHLDASIWNLVTGGAMGETFDFPLRSYLKLGTIALALAAMLAGCAWLAGRLVRRRGRLAGPMLAITLAVIVVGHNGVHAWANAAGYTPVTGQARILPFHRALTAKRWLRGHGLTPRSQDAIVLAASIGLNYPRAPLSCVGLSRRPNLLFVVVDSWRADALTPEVTPNLARLAGESQRFENHISGGNATRMGMFSLFYGLPGTYWHDMLGERRGAVLIQELMQQGYDVAVFRSAPLFSPELDRTIFLGVPGLRLRSDGERAWQRDRDLTTDFIGWLGRRDPSRPFFALLFYDSPHKYDFPPDWPLKFQPSLDEVDYLALTNSTDPEPFRNRYLNSVRYVDRLAGEAIDVVRARGTPRPHRAARDQRSRAGIQRPAHELLGAQFQLLALPDARAPVHTVAWPGAIGPRSRDQPFRRRADAARPRAGLPKPVWGLQRRPRPVRYGGPGRTDTRHVPGLRGGRTRRTARRRLAHRRRRDARPRLSPAAHVSCGSRGARGGARAALPVPTCRRSHLIGGMQHGRRGDH